MLVRTTLRKLSNRGLSREVLYLNEKACLLCAVLDLNQCVHSSASDIWLFLFDLDYETIGAKDVNGRREQRWRSLIKFLFFKHF